ncbi:hypothetical protein T439DRAFT_383839 [Meredithblackwellia eburnea MCA 4105]
MTGRIRTLRVTLANERRVLGRQEQVLVRLGIVPSNFTVHHICNLFYIDIRHQRLFENYHIFAIVLSKESAIFWINNMKLDLEQRAILWAQNPRAGMPRRAFWPIPIGQALFNITYDQVLLHPHRIFPSDTVVSIRNDPANPPVHCAVGEDGDLHHGVDGKGSIVGPQPHFSHRNLESMVNFFLLTLNADSKIRQFERQRGSLESLSARSQELAQLTKKLADLIYSVPQAPPNLTPEVTSTAVFDPTLDLTPTPLASISGGNRRAEGARKEEGGSKAESGTNSRRQAKEWKDSVEAGGWVSNVEQRERADVTDALTLTQDVEIPWTGQYFFRFSDEMFPSRILVPAILDDPSVDVDVRRRLVSYYAFRSADPLEDN